MANNFSKEIRIAWEDIGSRFEDYLILSKAVSKYTTDQQVMERSNNVIWRPIPNIATTVNAAPGVDTSTQFKNINSLSVPANIGFFPNSLWTMNAFELRDALQSKRFADAVIQKIASDVNVALMNLAATQGTLFVKRTLAATGYDDVAQIDQICNEQGVPAMDRYLALSSRDYNGMASNLANRQTMNTKPTNAYERSYVGMVSGFDTYKLDYAVRKTAAAGGGAITISTLVGAANFQVPTATVNTVSGLVPVDNRYQTITVSSTAAVVAGDRFTIGGVEAVHQITKGATGTLKTFAVIEVVNGTQLKISPGIVSNQGGSDAEAQYQNVIVTPSATAPIVFLNTAIKAVNPFWFKDAFEILPATLAFETEADILRMTSENGMNLYLQKFQDINTNTAQYRMGTAFGVVCKAPEMAGAIMFEQV